MTAMYRSTALENKELIALYGGQRGFETDEDYTSEDFDVGSESSEEGKGGGSVRRSLSLEIYGLQREQHVFFSNQEYYRRLEELKSAHLRNMSELERMYIGQPEDGDRGLGGRHNRDDQLATRRSTRKLQRINSQEELDFHDTSSSSDQNSVGELELDNPRRSPGQDQTFGRDTLLHPEDATTRKQFRFHQKASYPKQQGRMSHQTGVRVRSNFKVTVPKPFQMMLREEERKKHKVRTRSEIELENTLLRRELEELQECQKKFRASPAPAHIHLPLYEMISRRPVRRSNHSRRSSNQASAAASPQPFHFLERERRKREAKIMAELEKLGPKEERQAFKARPMPSSVYGTKHRANRQRLNMCTLEREATEGQSDPNSDLELDSSPDSLKPQRCLSKPVKKQMELSIEMVKERGASSTAPLKATAIYSPLKLGDLEPLLSESDCFSV